MLFSRQPAPDADSASALAAELGRAKQEFEARRSNVIKRVTQRQEHIVTSIKELQAEHDAHGRILNDA